MREWRSGVWRRRNVSSGENAEEQRREKNKTLVKNRSTKLRFVKKNVEDFDIVTNPDHELSFIHH